MKHTKFLIFLAIFLYVWFGLIPALYNDVINQTCEILYPTNLNIQVFNMMIALLGFATVILSGLYHFGYFEKYNPKMEIIESWIS